jgi:hypothetical protein
MKLILCIFEKLSCLTFIREFFSILEKQKIKNSSTSIFWDVSLDRSLPFRYLGIPIQYRKI